MKIHNKPLDNNTGVSGAEAASTETAGLGSKTRAGQKSAGQDSVSLSRMADLIALASNSSESSRSEHVAAIAARYRSGSYVVDNQALGEALINRAFED
jgi:anti-sigma28 factor (negative regulator of flagellin synthesis)